MAPCGTEIENFGTSLARVAAGVRKGRVHRSRPDAARWVMNAAPLPAQFVSESECFALLFSDDVRPAPRTLRKWKRKRVFPFVKIGRLVFCDPNAVRAAITGKFTIAPRA